MITPSPSLLGKGPRKEPDPDLTPRTEGKEKNPINPRVCPRIRSQKFHQCQATLERSTAPRSSAESLTSAQFPAASHPNRDSTLLGLSQQMSLVVGCESVVFLVP